MLLLPSIAGRTEFCSSLASMSLLIVQRTMPVSRAILRQALFRSRAVTSTTVTTSASSMMISKRSSSSGNFTPLWTMERAVSAGGYWHCLRAVICHPWWSYVFQLHRCRTRSRDSYALELIKTMRYLITSYAFHEPRPATPTTKRILLDMCRQS